MTISSVNWCTISSFWGRSRSAHEACQVGGHLVHHLGVRRPDHAARLRALGDAPLGIERKAHVRLGQVRLQRPDLFDEVGLAGLDVEHQEPLDRTRRAQVAANRRVVPGAAGAARRPRAPTAPASRSARAPAAPGAPGARTRPRAASACVPPPRAASRRARPAPDPGAPRSRPRRGGGAGSAVRRAAARAGPRPRSPPPHRRRPQARSNPAPAARAAPLRRRARARAGGGRSAAAPPACRCRGGSGSAHGVDQARCRSLPNAG